MNVLITDAELPSSLAMIRSLGKKDIKVIAISNSSKAIGFYSRYCYKAIKHLPTGYSIKNDSIILKHIEKEIKFIKSIKLIIDKFNIDLLIPNSENTLIPISKNRKEINALVPLPLHRTVMKVHDKGLMTRFCKKNNIPVPRTYFPKSESDIKNIIKGENFPLIIRSTVSEGSNNVYLCRNKEEIFNSYKQLINLKRKIMIQEYIFGDYYGFIGVLNKKSKLS